VTPRRRRGRIAPRAASGAAPLLVAASLGLAACGAATPAEPSAPSWRAAHPDPGPDVQFRDAAGVCVITVRYPDEAPGEIVVEMTSFVQQARSPRPAAPPAGRVVATSGDWNVIVVSPTELHLLTSGALFDYRAATC